MLNPDSMPWQIGLPIAGMLWAYLAVVWTAPGRRARRASKHRDGSEA